MHESSSRRGRLFTVESIAGWVFADLLLVLFLVGLGSAMAYTPSPEPPKPKAVAKAKPEPPPILGMKTKPTSITVNVDGARLGAAGPLSRREREAVCRAVRDKLQPVHKKRAALVLIFGGAENVEVGQNVARKVGAQLHCAGPHVFERQVATRAFWDGSLPLGRARLEVFLFVTGKRTS